MSIVKCLLLTVIFSAPLLPSPAFAITLDEGKRGKLVGEMANGYIGAVQPSPEVNALVAEINQKRKALYQSIAEKNGTPLSVVEQVGAKEAFQKSPAGALLQASSGGWVPKK